MSLDFKAINLSYLKLAYISFWIFLIALLLRLWDVGEIPYPVFDEIHFVQSAKSYLANLAPNDGHPPLGKYMIALGIAVFGQNELGYRITSILLGACIPILVISLTYSLTRQTLVSILSGILVLADGLFLVESRYGLLNTFLLVFGFSSQVLFFNALKYQGKLRLVQFALSGIMMGASASVKWNGIGFLLTTYLLIAVVSLGKKKFPDRIKNLGQFSEISLFHWPHYLLYFVLIPIVTYIVQWIPHIIILLGKITPNSHGLPWFQSFAKYLFISNRELLLWHSSPNAVGTHPYCSSALSWPFSMRPIGYYFSKEEVLWRDVHGLGNPVLWWFSTLAIIAIAYWGIRYRDLVCTYVLVGYSANYLPWFAVKRCVFIYHYMSAAAFSFIALAIVLSYCLNQQRYRWKFLGVMMLAAVIAAQIFFMPIWVGLPLSPDEFYHRMWFNPERNSIPGFNWI